MACSAKSRNIGHWKQQRRKNTWRQIDAEARRSRIPTQDTNKRRAGKSSTGKGWHARARAAARDERRIHLEEEWWNLFFFLLFLFYFRIHSYATTCVYSSSVQNAVFNVFLQIIRATFDTERLSLKDTKTSIWTKCINEAFVHMNQMYTWTICIHEPVVDMN